ncbi:MAG TPA: hypothetical protein VF426_01645 [Marmoricola sp.]
MTHHRISRAVVRIAMAALTVGLVGIAGAASADVPADWATQPHVSALDWIVVLVLFPVGIALVISLLVVVTTRGDSFVPGETWTGKDEWFGGPADKTAADGSDEATGGAGAEY